MSRFLKDYINGYEDVIETVSEMSKDQDVSFVESDFKGINFDKITAQYFLNNRVGDATGEKKNQGSYPGKSNDSVVEYKNMDYFVEFKNSMFPKKKDLYRKIRDSMLVYLDIIDEKLSYARENVGYILVFQKHEGFNRFENELKNLAKEKMEYGSIRTNCKGLYFKDVLFMSAEEFKKFVCKSREETD